MPITDISDTDNSDNGVFVILNEATWSSEPHVPVENTEFRQLVRGGRARGQTFNTMPNIIWTSGNEHATTLEACERRFIAHSNQ